MPKDTAKTPPDKPSKPYAGFPLFAHATRRWAKKIKGKLHYFGPWDDWQGALDLYQRQRDDLYAGRRPRDTRDGFTVRDLLNAFLTFKELAREAGEISQRTLADYHQSCDRIKDAFGLSRLVDDLRPVDFEQFKATLAKNRSPITLGNEINRVRVVFKYAFDARHITAPVEFGPGFARPSRKVLRLDRQKKGIRMFEAKELRQLIDGASLPLKAMILLGANCGFGNSDVAALPLSALELKAGWVDFARPKTGIERRCPLWPETKQALADWLAIRPTPKDEQHANLVFITHRGNRFSDENKADCAVTKETRKLLLALGLHRKGLGFYCLRRGFETVAGDTGDQVAVDFLMGHAPASNDMGSIYRQRVGNDRLRKIINHVHGWLWPRPTVG